MSIVRSKGASLLAIGLLALTSCAPTPAVPSPTPPPTTGPSAITPSPAPTAGPVATASPTPEPAAAGRRIPLTPEPTPTLRAPLLVTVEPTETRESVLVIAAGGTGGVYESLSRALVKVIDRDVPSYRGDVRLTTGPRRNLDLMVDRAARLALSTIDLAHYAFYEVEAYKGRPNTRFNAVAGLHLDTVHVVTANDAKVTSLKDLKGKRVGVGAPGTSNEQTSKQILGAVGLKYDDVMPVPLDLPQLADEYRDRNLDAVIVVAPAPNSLVQDLLAARPSRLLPIPSDAATTLQQKYAFFLSDRLAAGLYPGQTESLETLSFRNVLLAHVELDPAVVYQVTKAFWEHQEEMIQSHERLKDLSRAETLKGVTIPVHPGAKRYYDEVGVR